MYVHTTICSPHNALIIVCNSEWSVSQMNLTRLRLNTMYSRPDRSVCRRTNFCTKDRTPVHTYIHTVQTGTHLAACIHMYVCTYICTYMNTYVQYQQMCAHTHIHTCTHERLTECTATHMHTHANRVHACTYIQTDARMHTQTDARMYTHTTTTTLHTV